MMENLNHYQVEEGQLISQYKSRKSPRLKGFDYASNGGYFITINTKNRKHFFGEISKGIMGLSKIGCEAWKCWNEIPKHFPFVILDEFVAMPDHIHGILFIDKNLVRTQNLASPPSPPSHQNTYHNKFGPQSKNLSSILRGFKIGVTKNARKNTPHFAWQSRFHDHIIRDQGELNRIRKYIKDNPKNWGKDKYQL